MVKRKAFPYMRKAELVDNAGPMFDFAHYGQELRLLQTPGSWVWPKIGFFGV